MMNDMIQIASLFAAEKHKDQKYGSNNYTSHLSDVVRTLKEFGVTDVDMLSAAWLHDVVEDTDTSVDEIKNMFNDRVADLVWRVTNEPGKNRAERHEKTYAKIKASPDALRLKLADRIANVRTSKVDNEKLFKMYKKEYKGFKNELYSSGLHEDMWNELDRLINETSN